jgi:hypothetical protein
MALQTYKSNGVTRTELLEAEETEQAIENGIETHNTDGAAHEDIREAIADIPGVPVGSMVMYSSALSAPTGWLRTDGSQLLTANYPALFAVIGTTFGSDSAEDFYLPLVDNHIIRT